MRRCARSAPDYIDIYHVHEPPAGSALGDDLFEALGREKEKGSIRFIGVSVASVDAVVARFGSELDAIQSAESSWSEDRFVPDITHSLFSDAVRRQRDGLAGDSIRQMLERALARRRGGAVIVQTRRPKHLAQIVALAAGK